MSTSFDDYADVTAVTFHTARVEHTCCACHETIRPGDRYARDFCAWDGTAQTWKRCARCQKIFEHLDGLPDDRADSMIDRELRCGHSYEDVHGKPPPPEIAALAFALPGEVDLDEALEVASW